MNRFALLSLYRSLTRHRLYSVLNIGGLALGIAVFLVLGLYVRFETSFERWVPDHAKIYAIETVWNLQGNALNGAYPETMGGLLEQLREDFPAVVGTRIRGGEGGGTVLHGGGATTEDAAQVDPSFFQLFDLPMVAGEGARALADPTSAIVSESLARKYFGSSDPIGQTLTVSIDKSTPYRVAGIFRDLPANSDLKLSILTALPRTATQDNWYHWGSTNLRTFLRFDTPEAARAFAGRLQPFVNRRAFADMGKNAWDTERLKLLPLDRLHLEPQGSQSASQKMMVTALGVVGLLTLLIAIVNYVNLATARAGLRAREVAMRKVLGADRAALLRQFLGEAILTVAIASLLGLVLAELGLPIINAAGGLSLTMPYLLVVPSLIALTIMAGLAAGSYPAILLARFPAAAVLASARAPGGGRAGTRAREILVVFQFGLAIAFMIGTAVLVAQTRHVRHTDLGFQRDGLLIVRSLQDSTITPAQIRAFSDAMRAQPGVTGLTIGNSAAGGGTSDNSDNVPLPGGVGPGPSLRWFIVGPHFFDTYGARLLAGRLFDDAHGSDDSRTQAKGVPTNIVINSHALAALHFRSPQEAIGRTVGGEHPRVIIGVVEDLRFFSPRDPISPSLYYYHREPELKTAVAATIRFQGDPRAMNASTRRIWSRVVPQVAFDGDTADKRLEEYYRADDRAARLFGIGAGLAVLIGCVGLWGLASFNTQRRVKEIGIRKTLGASSTDIVKLLVGQFVRPVLLANLLAWPLAWAAMRTWLAGFDDRIALSPFYFLAASGVALLIAVLTVFGQSLRASRATPAWAMRYE